MTTMTAPTPRFARRPHSARGVSQLVRFAGAGGLGMVAYLTLYALWQLVSPMAVANVIAWTISTLLTNAAQRRFAFGVTDEADRRTDSAIAMGSSLAELVISAMVIAAIPTSAAAWIAMAAIWAVNAVIGGGRFLLMRWWLCIRTHHATA